VKKVGWDNNDVELAIEQFLEENIIIDRSKKVEYLLTCFNSKNQTTRIRNAFKYILENANNDLIHTATRVMSDRPAERCFMVLCFFNAIEEINNNTHLKYKFVNVFYTRNGRDIKTFYPQIRFFDKKGMRISYLGLSARELSYNFLDVLIGNYFKTIYRELQKKYRKEIKDQDDGINHLIKKGYKIDKSTVLPPYVLSQDLLNKKTEVINELIRKNRLLVINVKPLREFIYELELDRSISPGYNQSLNAIIKNISDTISIQNRKESTKRRYILIYCLVEELKDLGFGVRESFRKAGKLMGKTPAIIQARYYEQVSKLRKEGENNFKNLEREYNLEYEISSLLHGVLEEIHLEEFAKELKI